ncbi:MAG: T9SS type A sorting domain-containing protein [Bacteroidota bacterium]
MKLQILLFFLFSHSVIIHSQADTTCFYSLTFNNESVNDGVYGSRSVIATFGGVMVNSTGTVTFQALDSIILKPGFSVSNGALFSAIVGTSCELDSNFVCDPSNDLACVQRGELTINNETGDISIFYNKFSGGGSNFGIGYYASTDPNISTSDTFLGGQDVINTCANVPPFHTNYSNLGIVGDSFYVGMIVDYRNDIPETNEGNNNDCFWDTPKIIPPNALDCERECPPTASDPDIFCADRGQLFIDNNTGKLTISSTIVRGSGNFEIGYYASPNFLITTNDILIGSQFISSSGCSPVSDFTTNYIDLGISGDSFYVGIIVDYRNDIEECNESNNSCFWDDPKIRPPSSIQFIEHRDSDNRNLSSFRFSVSPNPTNDLLNYSLENATIQQVELYDLQGRLLLQDKRASGQLSLQSLPKGMYILVLQTSEGQQREVVVKK